MLGHSLNIFALNRNLAVRNAVQVKSNDLMLVCGA